MKEKQLADELNKWFAAQNNKNVNFWNQNPVAAVIKKNLSKWDNFKKKSKGYLDF